MALMAENSDEHEGGLLLHAAAELVPIASHPLFDERLCG
jgi:hypothetical protein